jgi:proton glutamate symport protein
MSSSLRVLLALLAGLSLGLLISVSHSPWLTFLPACLEPIGVLFIKAIQLSVIPLVVAGMIVGAASVGNARSMGRLGASAFLCILAGAFAAAAISAIISIPAFHFIKTGNSGIAAPKTEASLPFDSVASHPAARSTGQWIEDLVPANIIKAAAEDSLLPLVVFAIGFGLALTRIEATRRQQVVDFLSAVSDGFLALVGLIVRLAPVGVFALAVPLAARLGFAAAGALGFYMAVVLLINVAIILALYPAAALLGRVPLMEFVKAIAPAQAVAFTSRSSMAALPAAFEAAQVLRVQPTLYEFFLPLAASIFRVAGAAYPVAGVIFLARFYGVTLHWPQIVDLVVVSVLTSLTSPGVPGGVVLVMAPVLTAFDIPVAGVGILLAIDTIPDMFRTVANVTAWISAGTILNRLNHKRIHSGGA